MAQWTEPRCDEQGEIKAGYLVIGHQWWWEVQYLNGDLDQQFTTANEIHIPTRPVNIELESADVMHSFWIPGLHGKVDLIPGHINYIRLEASRVGSFPASAPNTAASNTRTCAFWWSRNPDEYAAWRQQQVKPAMDPATELPATANRPSSPGHVRCVTSPWNDLGGQVGPDLTHVGSRQYLAANTYPTTMPTLRLG